MKKEINEVKSLRWLANMFPFNENPKDETDKLFNAVNVYCTAGANKIEELTEIVNLLMKENDELKERSRSNSYENGGFQGGY